MNPGNTRKVLFDVRYGRKTPALLLNGIVAAALFGLLGSCGGGGSSGGSVPTPTPTPSSTAVPTSANLTTTKASYTLKDSPAHFTLTGCLVKGKTSDVRVLGDRHFFNNSSGNSYNLTAFSYDLDATGLLPDESGETDVGLSIIPQSVENSLNSGEEVFVTHIYDASPQDHGVVQVGLPKGGLRIASGDHLSIGSSSGLFPKAGGGSFPVADSRLADGKLLRVCYTAEFTQSGLSESAVSSYRSPYRDRNVVSDPARTTSPYTDFRNATASAIKVYGVGTFISNLTDSEPSDHATDIFVNGQLVTEQSLPSHVPGQSTPLFPAIMQVDITLQPGDVLSVRGKIKPKRAIVFDYAAFIFADPGLVPVNERLDVLPADLNGDGYNDLVDIDARGSIWVGLKVGAGLQDTQQEWARSVRNVDAIALLPRATPSDPLIVQATNSRGLCLDMTAEPASARFRLDYCNMRGSSTEADYWGDFNGDGFIDRMRIDQATLTYNVALGGPQGLTTQGPWITGYGAVDRIFVSDANGDGRDDFESEYSSNGLVCTVWTSTGSRFDQGPC
jgi:hypothetical protein